MRPQIEALLILQDRDQKIVSLRGQQTNAPRERRKLEAKLAAARDSLDLVKQRAKENEVERRKLELAVETKETAISRFKTQQQQTRKNEEFQALSHEIAHAEGEIHALEDRELDLMEQAESLQQGIVAAEQEFARTQASISSQLRSLEENAAAATARLGELEGERENLAEKVGPDTLFLYDRLFAKKGDAAVVPLEQEICGGCHMKVPTQAASQVRGDQALVQCPNCGRILYRVL